MKADVKEIIFTVKKEIFYDVKVPISETENIASFIERVKGCELDIEMGGFDPKEDEIKGAETTYSLVNTKYIERTPF